MTDEAEAPKVDLGPYWPFPELLTLGRGGEWAVGGTEETAKNLQNTIGVDIVDGAGGINLEQKVFMAPVNGPCSDCGQDHNRAIRNHEMIHAQFTASEKDIMAWQKSRPQGLRMPYDEAARLLEEVRTNLIGAKLGFTDSMKCAEPDEAKAAAADKKPPTMDDLIVRAYGTIGSPDYPMARIALETAFQGEAVSAEMAVGAADELALVYADAIKESAAKIEAMGTISQDELAAELELQTIWEAERVSRLEESEVWRKYSLDLQVAANKILDGINQIAAEAEKALSEPFQREDWTPFGPNGMEWLKRNRQRVFRQLPQKPGNNGNGNGQGSSLGGSGSENASANEMCEGTNLAKEATQTIRETQEGNRPQGKGYSDPEARQDWRGGRPEGPEQMGGWGHAKFVYLPLTIKTKEERLPKPHQRPVEEGQIMAYPHRWAVDKAVFARKRRVRRPAKTGVVLIDTSGSMSWDVSELTKLIEEIPAGVVAIYSGNGSNRGIITILAKDGKRVDFNKQAIETLGWNTIDGPALKWIGTLPGPRIWVSDGLACGTNDSRKFKAARDLAIENKIARVRYIEDAIELLREGRTNFTADDVPEADRW